ncbi:glycoside hydrolase family 3 N-terminal domain-containing protein [Streptomyces pathocidini]|uniref:glycoside hydrolase family 3 N-terminal domain-containing protein n=1 Tax=Streptomyces pathocidini TaxID=1650571 RepID=UPI0033C28372
MSDPERNSVANPAKRLPEALSQAVNRCLVVGFDGTAPTDELKRLIDEGLGGVILHTRNVASSDQLRTLTGQLKSLREDLLISIDQEGGGIGHLVLAGGAETPGNWALGVVDDPALTADVAGVLADNLADHGITVGYGPVADAHRESANPIVRTRAFGADPEHVSRHVTAWVEAWLARGVAPCAKHFPGHGSTTVDSHHAAAVDPRGLDELRAIDLVPFRAAIDAGVPLVMTSHVTYPKLDPLPATVSRRILTGLLREELGYQGVVVTDALEMKAIADEFGEEAGAHLALAAGADQLCIVLPEPELWFGCAAAVRTAIADGSLDEARVGEAAERVRKLAARFAKSTAVTGASDGAPYDIGLRAARRALGTAPSAVVPVAVAAPYVVDLFRAPHPALEWDRFDLVNLLRSVLPSADGVSVTGEAVDRAEILRRAEGRPLVIATEDADLHPWQHSTRAALRSARPDALLIATGMPDAETAAAGGLCTYGRGRANLRAAAEALAGGGPEG